MIVVDKELVKDRLIKLEEYILDLKKYQDISLQEYQNDKILRRYIERSLHLAIESCLDIGNHIISDERLGVGSSNVDIIRILTEQGIIKDNQEKYIKMAKFRNIIVHDYIDISGEVIIDILKNGIKDLETLFIWYRDYVK